MLKLDNDVLHLKKIIKKYYMRGDYDKALSVIDFFGNFMYQLNQTYVDNDIENIMKSIAQSLPLKVLSQERDENRILFYDGLGLDTRGLAQIYIKALINLKKEIIYVVPEERKDKIPLLTRMITASGGKIVYVASKKYYKSIEQLIQLINDYKVSKLVLYIMPNDIIPLITSILCENIIKRFLINLTDHAFWLGTNAIDYTIEFRDYGASLSWSKRNISKDKIVKLPYYPQIDKDIPFAGFPFNSEKKKVMFSGGGLYKTYGDNDKYYLLVKKILIKENDLIFLYAGSGNGKKLFELKKQFPGRVFWIEERKDLFQIMKHSDIYLNTYPMIGGLMTQYAVAAETVPLTLLYDECGKGCILHPEKLHCEFYNMNELIEYASFILHDPEFINSNRENFKGQFISEKTFEKELLNILQNGKSDFQCVFTEIDTTDFQKTYIERLFIGDYFKLWTRSLNFIIIKNFPVRVFLGEFTRVIRKINEICKNKML